MNKKKLRKLGLRICALLPISSISIAAESKLSEYPYITIDIDYQDNESSEMKEKALLFKLRTILPPYFRRMPIDESSEYFHSININNGNSFEETISTLEEQGLLTVEEGDIMSEVDSSIGIIE